MLKSRNGKRERERRDEKLKMNGWLKDSEKETFEFSRVIDLHLIFHSLQIIAYQSKLIQKIELVTLQYPVTNMI